jgi:hypothetical protein
MVLAQRLCSRAPRVALVADRFDRFTEVYARLDRLALERVSDFDSQLSKFTLGRREVIS